MKKTLIIRAVACTLCAFALLGLVGCGEKEQITALDKNSPVTVTVWNYYNGDQLTAFEDLIDEFNSTVGLEKGIVVVDVSQGDINTLANTLLSAVRGEAGAQEIPSLAAVYSETAYILANSGVLVDLDSYFSEEDLKGFVPEFINEGRFNKSNELLLFPISKSTELFAINETDWAPFAAETGITVDSLKTCEDLTAAAKRYYEWTDAQTPDVPEDGKALYGRDSVANYIYVGSCQLGHEIFKVENGVMTLDMNREAFRTLWDNYYVPIINGYFGAYGKYRSDDCKTGKIIALTSSSSSVGYLPSAVTLKDDSTYDITLSMHTPLIFKDADNSLQVQQGASYCMLRSTPAEQEGAAEFLRWFTDTDRNLQFSRMSGYSPVTLTANEESVITAACGDSINDVREKLVYSALLLNADTFKSGNTYSTTPFNGSKDARTILGDALQKVCTADREAVLEKIAAGATREEAVAPYITDDYFNTWFDELYSQIVRITAE